MRIVNSIVVTMKHIKIFGIIFMIINFLQSNVVFAQNTLELDKDFPTINLKSYLAVLEDDRAEYTLQEAKEKSFQSLDNSTMNADAYAHWLRFNLKNTWKGINDYYLSIAFADTVELFYPNSEGSYVKKESGDRYPLYQRDVKLGQVVVFKFPIYPGEEIIYVRVRSGSKLSQEARRLTLYSPTLYSDSSFNERFEDPRYYQALFYGAMLIMFFYNFFIFISLKSFSYLYYTLYMLGAMLFFASNTGYMLEFFIPDFPTLDIYLRFASVPILMIFYLLFSRSFLNIPTFLKKTDLAIRMLMGVFGITFIVMLSGQWMLGRNLTIFLAIVAFVMILIVAIIEYRKGFSPARYFLAANVLLLLGAITFALEKTSMVVHNHFTQYSIQIGIVLEVGLFSIGLADRINLTRKQLAEEKLANERLEKEQSERLRKLTEQKNEELEIKVKERTAEVVAQKEEIEEKNKDITASIRYAQRIQQAVLGGKEEIIHRFKSVPANDAFVLFMPRDIVSGDFYWYGEVEDPEIELPTLEEGAFIPKIRIMIVADCTGHGVPGAFMTMLGSSVLDEIIHDQQVIHPSIILKKLDERIRQTLLKDQGHQTNDGMDMVVLAINDRKNEAIFAGAKNPLFIVRDGEIQRIKGSKFPIGSNQYGTEKDFESHQLTLKAGDRFYLSSDGYQDQWSNEKKGKFLRGRFEKLILEIYQKPMAEQELILKNAFLEWKGDTSQTDDVLLVGLKV
jgi:serine phosphatase RsbU (regulator of sigma subunit)